MKQFICIVFCSCLNSFSSQIELEGVEIHGRKSNEDSSIYFAQRISSKEIERSGAYDVGDLTRKLAGVSLKNYGSIGSLKSFTFRGFGANHVQVMYDGFALLTNQSGIIDLGNIKAATIQELELQTAVTEVLPASAYIASALLGIKTDLYKTLPKKLNINYGFTLGSFGLVDHNFNFALQPTKRWKTVISMGRTEAKGDYSFHYKNVDSLVNSNRSNNDFLGYTWNVSSVMKFKKNGFQFTYAGNKSDQGLPGAVILYAPKSVQRLSRTEQRLGLLHNYYARKIALKNYMSYQNDRLHYVDSSYLNSLGYLVSTYSSEHVTLGSTLKYHMDSNWSIFTSNEIAVQRLQTLNYSLNPTRITEVSVVGTNGSIGRIDLQSFIGNTFYSSLDSMQRTHWKNQLIGFIGISCSSKGLIAVRSTIFYKSSFRLPSFNELYYQQIGNLNLKPELSNQVNAQISALKSNKSWSFRGVLDVFYNVIENRILAIPTKNLFQWSIQNIGKSEGYGLESKVEMTKTMRNHSFEIAGTYSFQRIMDKTDVTSTTYKNILPYQPLHSSNASFSYGYKKIGATVNYNFVSARYSLTQNISSNEISYFNLVDLAIWSKFTVARNTFKCIFNVKNLTNSSYAYVKNYFMPGINYQITLVYGFK